jgi:hypothetical protein
MMACELMAWMQMLALTARTGLGTQTAAAAPVLRRRTNHPRRLRTHLRLAATRPCASHLTTAITRLQALAPG